MPNIKMKPRYRAMISYDYVLQVWLKDGIVQPCAHPTAMRKPCCSAYIHKGRTVQEARANDGVIGLEEIHPPLVAA